MNMNIERIKQDLGEVQKGLNQLGRQRKIVLPHHESFELIDELETKLSGVLVALEQGDAAGGSTVL